MKLNNKQFSVDNWKGRRELDDILNILEEKDLPTKSN
jgi:hypothetical protein